MINLSEPNISKKEIDLVKRVLYSKKLVDDYFQDKTEQLIKKIIKCKYVALTQSCSSALEVAAIIINLKKGDEILMPSYTFTSTANAVVMRGAKPIFVDIKANLNLDLNDLEKKITKKTKAIFVVHYAGMSCDMAKLIMIKKKYKLILVEDAAHAFLGKFRNKYLGTFGDISTFSFHATKNIVGAQAGALVINNKKYLQKADIILDKGTNRKQLIKYTAKKIATQSLKKKKYYEWKNIGSEYRASEISSALVYCQITRRKELQAARSNIWKFYFEKLFKFNQVDFKILTPEKHSTIPFHNFVLIMKSAKVAKKLTSFLYKKKIFASFHYIPLHSAQFSKKILKNKQILPVTENIYKRVLRLPLHANLSIKDSMFIVNCIKSFFKKKLK